MLSSLLFLLQACAPSRPSVRVTYEPSKLQGKARLMGRLVDAKTNEPVWAAVVSIEGTNLVSGADYNGQYYFDNIPLGKSTVKVKSISTGAFVLQEINVKPNQIVVVDFTLAARDTTLNP